ncbi:ABC transporter substrate-binding protein [Streptomyces heilongjiangensis]|uniref:ABC transporter substrate-binding protein n=1 Tax=Streptomyces heilongjiangensis TaxID=945052 RepID=A0ABW1BBT8_9ACTN|nr:ABC transporter substrate-binding protein [Streptomyces heilongjiangensis]MDC2950536.1 ABC transporter substrate-binding protein [Streptomyces heilongjiangensis]
MTKRSRGPWGRLPVAAVTLAVAAPLAACGSQASSSASGDGKARITVLRSTGALFEPLYIAEQQGYFKDAGLEVTIKAGAPDTSQNAPSVLNGEAQFAMTDSAGFLKGAAKKMPVRVVSGLVSSTAKGARTEGLLVKKDSSIKRFADLEGKTVGLSALGTTIQFLAEYLVEQDGGDPSKVKFVALPVTSLNDAASTGKTDAVYSFGAFYAAGKAAGLRSMGKGMSELPGIPQGLLFSSQEYLSANSGTTKKFTDAVAKALTYANEHPEAVKAIDKKYTQLPPDYIDKASIANYDKNINTTVMRTMITKMNEYGLLTSAPKDDALYWNQAPTVTSGS